MKKIITWRVLSHVEGLTAGFAVGLCACAALSFLLLVVGFRFPNPHYNTVFMPLSLVAVAMICVAVSAAAGRLAELSWRRLNNR